MLDVSATSVRPGNHLSLDRGVWAVVNYEHVKPGKGGAFVRIKLKNIQTGAVLEKTLDADAKVQQVEVEEHPAQYLYRAGDKYVFMNLESYEQTELGEDELGGEHGYLKPDIEVKFLECEGKLMGVSLPITVQLKIVETPPGVKGDTVSRGTKQAVLETGIKVNVPLFLDNGDVIKLDTRTGEYLERM